MLRRAYLSPGACRSVARAFCSVPGQAPAHDGHADISVANSIASEYVPRIANLSGTRGVIRLAGADVLTFLQGLVTNDVSRLAEAGAPPLYAAILNAQGRVLQDLFLHRQEGEDTVLLVDAHRDGIPELLKSLRRYKLRAAVDIADVSEEYAVWASFGWGAERKKGWPMDPRLSVLGQRAVLAGPPQSSESAPSIYSRQYRHWRIEHGVAEGNEEIPAGEAIPLEYNLDVLQGISFDKGCYVGQELVARAHWSGTVRKRLMPFALKPPEGAVAVGAGVVAEGVKRPAGVVKVINAGSGRGLAVLRLQQALAAAHGKQRLHIQEQPKVQLQPWRPSWWPPHLTADPAAPTAGAAPAEE
mmetsp:Transcript_16306/g.48902  ORF Transcript_16306/g.48902 Transcript_16306/m.48902 type:complete len:357 (+) Transcript_16306:94-1164(+)